MRLRDLSTLQLALGVSVLAHATLLAVHVADPEAFERVLRDTPLEVILVNASTKEEPTKAQAIAQRSLAGGGDSANLKERATSPLPPSAFTAVGDSSEEVQRRQLESMQAQQTLLLSQIHRQLAAMPPPDPNSQGTPAENVEQEEKRRQLLEMLAEIERRVNDENGRPKKRYISPATREAVYAAYVDALRRRIESRGTKDFPEASGKKLYGQLTMMVTVNSEGELIGAEVVASSGNRVLDGRAQAIVQSVGNFGKFSDAMRKQTDQIVLPSRFKFTRDETLETQLSSSNR